MIEDKGTAGLQPARLLVVESDGHLGSAVAGPTGRLSGVEPIVIALSTGRLSLDLLKISQLDLVIADIDALADIDKLVEDRIGRLARAASGALLVVVSDDPSISVALGAMRAGAHDCVGKGIGPEQLVARIGQLARRHGKAEVLLGKSAQGPEPAPEPSIPVMHNLVLPMWRQEQRIIESAIQSFAGNVALAAAALELSPSTIYRKRQAWAEMEGKRGAA
jgi:DNA-binding NtrC family response regulator